MLDSPSLLRVPQHEGAAAQVIVTDMEGDDGDIIEHLNAYVFGVKPYLRRTRGPHSRQHPREGFIDSLLADEA